MSGWPVGCEDRSPLDLLPHATPRWGPLAERGTVRWRRTSITATIITISIITTIGIIITTTITAASAGTLNTEPNVLQLHKGNA